MSKKRNDTETVNLTRSQLRLVGEAAAKEGVKAYREQEEAARRENKDKRHRNTRLMMEKYRGLKKYSEEALFNASQAPEDLELQEFLELMGAKDETTELTVESIQASAARTRLMLDHITKFLEYYHYECKKSKRPEDMKKWETVRWLYLEEDRKTVTELAEMFYVDESTVYRYHRAAIRDLETLFFGIGE